MSRKRRSPIVNWTIRAAALAWALLLRDVRPFKKTRLFKKKRSPSQRRRARRGGLLVGFIYFSILASFSVFVWTQFSANRKLAAQVRVEFNKWFASLPKIPDEENGAICILRGLELLEEFPVDPYALQDEYLGHDEKRKALLSRRKAKDIKTVREYLARNRKALNLIEEGLEFSKWNYPKRYAGLSGWDNPHTTDFRCKVIRAFEVKGYLAQKDGELSDALKEYIKVLRLGGTLSSDRTILSCLVELSIYGSALGRMTKFFWEKLLSEEKLGQTIKVLVELHSKRGGFFRAIEGDCYSFFKRLADGLEGVEPTEEVDEEIRTEAAMVNSWFSEIKYFYDLQKYADMRREFLELFRGMEPANYHSIPGELKDPDYLTKRFGVPEKGWMVYLPWFHVMKVTEILKACAVGEAFWCGVIVRAGVRLFEARNGRLPRNLDELGGLVPKELLIDPFSGKQLIYRLKGDDFCLYSVGLDGIDGKCEDTRELFKFKTGADEGEPDDIIFHAPRPK